MSKVMTIEVDDSGEVVRTLLAAPRKKLEAAIRVLEVIGTVLPESETDGIVGLREGIKKLVQKFTPSATTEATE